MIARNGVPVDSSFFCLYSWHFIMFLTKTHLQTLRRLKPGENRLSKALELAGITQTACALDLGYPSSYVSDLTRDRYQDMTLKNARKFADYFGCAIEDIFPK